MRGAAGGVAGKLRGHHRTGRGHGTTGTLYARPNYCTGQPSAETPLHNRREPPGWDASKDTSSRFTGHTQTLAKGNSCGTNTPVDVAFLGCPRECVCIGEQLFAHTDARLGALLFPLGVGLHTRRRRRVRTILQHCFLRRSITQRKFPTKLRKHFFFPAGARGRHDGCLAPPTESTTTWNPAELEIPH